MEETTGNSTCIYVEAITSDGQQVKFLSSPEVAPQLKKLLKDHVEDIDIPTTGRVAVSHGGYGKYTRYDITQHKYAGGGPGEGGGGYIEVLEIKNPPDNRCGIVLNEWNSGYGSTFTEWETLEAALNAFDKNWCCKNTAEAFAKLPGFKRLVHGGALNPWFYAIGNEQLIGDYAFPDGLQDDPVFRFGNKFVVFDDDIPTVKTCMGTRFIQDQQDYHPFKRFTYRIVYWDDGTMWNENRHSTEDLPRPLEDGEVWITEAIKQFHLLLTGKTTDFSIDFTDGGKFMGKWKNPNPKVKCAAGDYYVVMKIQGDKEDRKGWVRGFEPTPQSPNIVSMLMNNAAEKQRVVERIEVRECKTEHGGKKWAGVFLNRK